MNQKGHTFQWENPDGLCDLLMSSFFMLPGDTRQHLAVD